MYRHMATDTSIDEEPDSSCFGSEYSAMNTDGLINSSDLLYQLRDLSADDKELLRNCWHYLSKNKENVAVEIFVLIFKQCPETKKLFYFADSDQQGNSSKRMKDDSAFQFHALRFIQIIESMIDHLDNPTAVEPVLQGLGQLHLRFRDKFGFQTYFWSVFSECTIFVFRERLKPRIEDIDRAVTLWRMVLGAINQKMMQAFNAGDRKRRDLLSSNVGQMSDPSSPAISRGKLSTVLRPVCPQHQNLDGDFSDVGVQATSDNIG